MKNCDIFLIIDKVIIQTALSMVEPKNATVIMHFDKIHGHSECGIQRGCNTKYRTKFVPFVQDAIQNSWLLSVSFVKDAIQNSWLLLVSFVQDAKQNSWLSVGVICKGCNTKFMVIVCVTCSGCNTKFMMTACVICT